MNPDKGFREWFAKTVIMYATQAETKIIKRHLIRRIQDEADIAHNWQNRWYIAHFKGFWLECVKSMIHAVELALVGFLYLFAFCYIASYHCYPESKVCWKVTGDVLTDEFIDMVRQVLHLQFLALNKIIHVAPFVKDVVSKVCV